MSKKHKFARPCNKVGCPNLTHYGSYCKEHWSIQYERCKERETSYNRGYDAKWRRFRKDYLYYNPMCVRCGDLAEHVDHIIPLRKGGDKYSHDNLQSLCHSCHSRKSATEDKLL